jgi:amidohydrolase
LPAELELDGLVALRRDLHAHPELRFCEHRTAKIVASRLRNAGWAVTEGVGGTGVVATLMSARPGPCIAVRADMDALPVQDNKQVPYASRQPGVMHACGHDVHVAVVVGLGERLARDRSWAGTVKLIFQPAEEIPFGEASGGAALVEAGVLEDPHVDIVLGLHCWPTLPAGTIGIDDVIAMAAKDAFRISVNGEGAHAATPSLGVDAILAASQTVVALHHLVSRGTDAADQASLNVGTTVGGHSQSVLADMVEMTGTIRTVSPEIRQRLKRRLEEIVAGVAIASGAAADVQWANAMPAVRNDPALVKHAVSVLSEFSGVERVQRLIDPPMTTDDFALYAERRPGLYLKLGVARPDGCHPLHHSQFDVDESAIGTGVEALNVLLRSLVFEPPQEFAIHQGKSSHDDPQAPAPTN